MDSVCNTASGCAAHHHAYPANLRSQKRGHRQVEHHSEYGLCALLGTRFLLAQFVQQQVSFAGRANRSPVNRTDLDLYGVYSARSLQWWINTDFNLRIDEADHGRTPSSVTVTYGRGLRKVFGGSLNGSLQSGAGIRRNRPYDFMLTGGISVVGIHLAH